MNQNKAIVILIGIGMTLLFSASFIGSKSSFDIFNASLGVMVILFGFYHEDKKISYLIALFCVNIFQWIILIYSIFNNPASIKANFYYLVGAPLFTLVLANQIRINHLKTKINIQIDKIKLILLFTGAIIIIGSLASFIVYFAPIFLYGATLGLMVFIYGFYHEDKKVNVSERHDIANTLTKNVNFTKNYAISIGSLLISQFFILCYFFHQISIDDWANAFSFSIMIAILFSIQIYRSDLKFLTTEKKIIPNKKTEKILEIVGIIGAIILFIGIFSAFYLTGSETNQTENNFNQINAAENDTILNNYSILDTSYKNNTTIPTKSFSDYGISFNYPSNWDISSKSNYEVDLFNLLFNEYGTFTVQMFNNNGYSDEEIIKQSEDMTPSEWNKIASYKLIIDNKTAYEDIYTYKDNVTNILMRSAQIILVKNDNKYFMSFEAADEDFDEEKSDFAVILNSFKVDENQVFSSQSPLFQ